MAYEGENLDLSAMTFDQFVEFFFKRKVVMLDPPLDYLVDDVVEVGREYDEAVPSHAELLVEYMTKLFLEFDQIAPKYSMAQINRGMWTILGPGLGLPSLLWDAAIPLDRRLRCIRSMYHVYSDFVGKSDVKMMENCFDMWWDLISKDFWFQTRLWETKTEIGDVSKLDAESRTLLDAIFETLKRILELPDTRTQMFTMHGLGHIHHPDVPKTVQGFIDANKGKFTEQNLQWIEQCRDGNVM